LPLYIKEKSPSIDFQPVVSTKRQPFFFVFEARIPVIILTLHFIRKKPQVGRLLKSETENICVQIFDILSYIWLFLVIFGYLNKVNILYIKFIDKYKPIMY